MEKRAQDVRGLLLTVCGKNAGMLEPGGTCFLIARGLAVTAKHVLQDIHDRFALKDVKAGQNSVDYTIQVSGQWNMKNIDYGVEEAYHCPLSDMTLLSLRALTQEAYDFPVQQPLMDFWPPTIGSTVYTFGYARQSVKEVDGVLHWESLPTASEGVVQEYHPERRDSAFVTFPAFRANAPILGHMSGSPVGNESGAIVGVLSNSVQEGEEGREPITYAASLWPLLRTLVALPRQGRPEGERYHFFDLYREGILKGLHWDSPNFDPLSPEFLKNVPVPKNYKPVVD